MSNVYAIGLRFFAASVLASATFLIGCGGPNFEMLRPTVMVTCQKMALHRCGKVAHALFEYIRPDGDKASVPTELQVFASANLSTGSREQIFELVDFAQDVTALLDSIPGASAALKSDTQFAKAKASFEEVASMLAQVVADAQGGKQGRSAAMDAQGLGPTKGNERALTFAIDCAAKGNSCAIRFETAGDGRVGISSTATSVSVSTSDLLRAAHVLEAQGGRL